MSDTLDIIDCHHHIWLKDKTPWLQGPIQPRIFGDYTSIRRDYAIEEYAADAKPQGVVKSVYVQINVAPDDVKWEPEWALDEGKKEGLVNAVTAYANLADPDVASVLDSHVAAGNVRGIRQQLHWHEKDLYRFAKRPDVMLDSDWQRGLAEVQKRGLHFELQVFENQYDNALNLIDAFPGVHFVLLHGGMPEDTSPAGLARWQEGLQKFAAYGNVSTKISGFGTFTRTCDVAHKKPLVERAVDAFGPKRCMFGSNFPIEKLWTSYEHLIEVVRECLTNYSEAEQRAVLHDTAARLYRI